MNMEWTRREGELTLADKTAIRALAENWPLLRRFFLTGEMRVERLGDVISRALLYANSTVEQPLFVLTNDNTIRMVRFNFWSVTPLMTPTTVAEAAKQESARWGYPDHLLMQPDFYASMFWHAGLFDTATELGTPHANYLNALTLFRKPLYLDIPASLFFCNDDVDLTAGRYTISEDLIAERDKVWCPSVARLTNDELDFITGLK